jgi:DHA1 family multidrug resistance protein-like MFS transporter
MVKSSESLSLTRESQIARASRAIILAGFLSNLAFNFIFPLVPLYMREIAGPGPATALWSGLALAASPMGGAIAAPIWGRQADRVGYRPMLLSASASTAIFIALMALPNAPWQLVLLRFLSGAFGSVQGMTMGALGSWSRSEDLSRVISRLQMAQMGGAIAGPVAGGLVAAFFGIRFAPLAGGIALALGTILVAQWLHEPLSKRAKLTGAVAPLKLSYLWLPILTLVVVQFTDASFNPILPLLLAQGTGDVGTIAGLVGTTASLSALAAAIAAGLSGHLMRKGVRYSSMIAATCILALLALASVVAPLPWGLMVLRILAGGTVAGVAVGAFSAGGLAVEPRQRGAAYGWLASSSMAGFAASPIVAGLLAAIDLRAVLVLDVFLCLLSAGAWGVTRGITPAATPVSTEKRLSTSD